MSKLFDGQPVIEFRNDLDRRNFLKWAGIIGVGGTLVLAGCGSDEETPGAVDDAKEKDKKLSANDEAILNYALTLEYLEADFYKQGTDANLLTGREQEIAKAIAAHEAAHVATLTQTINDLGGTPADKPRFTYPDNTFKDKAAFLKTASTFEELGVTAYHGQVTKIEDPATLLGAAASIAGVESRHAAVLAQLTGGKPFPAPVEANKSMEEVLPAVQPFLAK